MAKFLATSGVNHLLEELIKSSEERIVLLTPYLHLNNRLRELLAARSRTEVKIQLIYKKLPPAEERWLREVPRIKVKHRPMFHAKCYLTEKGCIITSLNLLEFSQQNNDEMGVLILRDEDGELYEDTAAEVAHLVRGSTETHADREELILTNTFTPKRKSYKHLSVSNLAKKLGIGSGNVYQAMIGRGLMKRANGEEKVTEYGKALGGRERIGKNGTFTVWPADLKV